MKPNQERVDFLLIRKTPSWTCSSTSLVPLMKVLWAMEAYRKGIDHGFQMPQEVDPRVNDGDEDEASANT
jgi:hypothetical protein